MSLLYRTMVVLVCLCWLAMVLASCSQPEVATHFLKVAEQSSGIRFANTIQTSDTFNILNFHYIYNGGGVGVRDFNRDGLPDLVFSGNQVPSKLYLNQGNLQFKDITASSGMRTESSWTTGISINDINADGWPDIYFSVGGLECGGGQCNNLLFLHQGLDAEGLPIFKEVAEAYGLADDRYTQQALFLDIDRDCDLDVYLLHNVIDNRDKNAPSPQRFINAKAKDQLLRNDGEAGFVDVSADYGITGRGYGLGIASADFNRDGWPDIYVANDFLSSDLLYLNEEGQGFREVAKDVLKHQSYNSMGVDIGDLNGDALAEILVLDMLPATNERRKRTQGFMNYDKYLYSLQEGYAPQFVRNTLQLNNGSLAGAPIPFSDISYQANIYQTDWSWSPLFADYDNDGDQDLFVTNGYGKDITDLDFIKYSQQANAFGTAGSVQEVLLAALADMPENRLQNYLFQHDGDFQFEDVSKSWLPSDLSISNGAAYADLDKDGDLDLVINNINEPAYLLENTTESAHFMQLQLQGDCQGGEATGAQVHLWVNGQRQYRYYSPVRGYLSTVDDVLHFGLGGQATIDSLWIDWPDGTRTVRYQLEADQRLLITQASEEQLLAAAPSTTYSLLLGDTSLLSHIHRENAYQDYDVQPLLLTQPSRLGPALARGVIDEARGIYGLFVGASAGESGVLYQLNQQGGVIAETTLLGSMLIEMVDALFFDADGDGDDDLYLVAGGAQMGPGRTRHDQLYLQQQAGDFELALDRLPDLNDNGSCVRAADFDLDGDLDLFVGSGAQPGGYPKSHPSRLLVNNNGTFIPQEEANLPSGLITDACWVDINDDQRPDLVVVGEWMPITVFLNLPSGFERQASALLAQANGLWQSITPVDIDGDGDQDFIVGNCGNNTPFEATSIEPLLIVQDDMDGNGKVDPFLAWYATGTDGERRAYTYHSRDDLVRQCPKIQQTYGKYEDFAQASFAEIIGSITEKDITTKEVHKTESVWLEMQDGMPAQLHDLPAEAQISPIKDAHCLDLDRDGRPEIFLVGNDYGAEKNGGRHDASNGLLLRTVKKGILEAITTAESGFLAPGDARKIAALSLANEETLLFVSQNDGALLTFRHQQSSN